MKAASLSTSGWHFKVWSSRLDRYQPPHNPVQQAGRTTGAQGLKGPCLRAHSLPLAQCSSPGHSLPTLACCGLGQRLQIQPDPVGNSSFFKNEESK